MFLNLLFVAYVAYEFGNADHGQSQEHNCKRENNVTLFCNFLPESIPNGVKNVHLNLELIHDIPLNHTTFLSSGWDNIKVLEVSADSVNGIHMILQDNCFIGLKGLQSLRLHITTHLQIISEAFYGLENVDTLDMYGSYRLNPDKFVQALNGSNILPRLTKLVLSNCSLYERPFVIDKTFVQVLDTKKITFLDVSGIQVSEFNITSFFKGLKHLEVINASNMFIGDFTDHNLEKADLAHIKTVDVSYITLPRKSFHLPPGKFILQNLNAKFSQITHHENLKLLLSPEAVNLSGLIPYETSLWIMNCTVEIDQNPLILTKEIIMRQNNIKRLDAKVICEKFQLASVEIIDISENELEFLPEVSPCLPNVRKIDMSKNKLIKMAQENISLFENTFSRFKLLKYINLSRNDLITIPSKMFEYNTEIEVINLSDNKLDQVNFILISLKKLQILNLQGNNIHALDPISINNLNSIENRNSTHDPYVTVILKFNPLSCSKCETKQFLFWLVSTHLVNVTSQNLKCSNENGLVERIDEKTVEEVNKICERKTIIIYTSMSTGVIVLILGIALCTVYKRRKYTAMVRNRANVINLLRKGETKYEFAVFLAFSSDDEDFVSTCILHQLNDTLQLITDIERELVCTGDRHFRPGFYVHDETFKRLDTASVMIVVASESFCQSSYCQNEFDQAYVNRKPIILMFIEHIDQDVMTPTMKELYQKNVRILWTVENGENVCTSILDLIQ